MFGGPEATEKFPVRSRELLQLFLQIARSQRASDGATVELQPPQVMVPGMVMPQALAGPLQALPRGISAGAIALQPPLQPITPGFVEPQLFAAEVQAVPYPDGRAGAPTLQAPEQRYVPEFETPQTLATEQAFPRYHGLGGVTPVQAPAQLIVPQPCAPQAFGADQHPLPYPLGRAGALTLQAPGDPRGLKIPDEVHVRLSAFTNLSPHQTLLVTHMPYSGVPLH